MSADRQNVTLYSGDDCILAISIVDETGVALNVTGATFVWSLARTAGTPAILTKTSAGGGVVITNATTGAVQVTLTHNDTAASSVPPFQYWHQLVMTDPSGNVSTVTTGYITVRART